MSERTIAERTDLVYSDLLAKALSDLPPGNPLVRHLDAEVLDESGLLDVYDDLAQALGLEIVTIENCLMFRKKPDNNNGGQEGHFAFGSQEFIKLHTEALERALTEHSA